jgi:hypothetical protein
MKKLFLTILLCAVLVATTCAAAPAEEAKESIGGIVYGEDHAFVVDAPEGWVLDNKSGVGQGLYAVFYPKGESWENATAVMYVNTAKREESDTVATLIEYDTAQFKRGNPDVSVEKAARITTSDDKEAEVRYFTGDQWGNSEAVAYIEEETIFVLIVLTSRTKEAFESAKPAFGDLVKSYSFWTTDVQIETDEVNVNSKEPSPAAKQ